MTTQTEGQVPEEEQVEGQEPETNEEGTRDEGTPENETFSREYVQELRSEAAEYRTRAKTADTLREALWAERVKADGRLVDADDLPMPDDADPLDADAVSAAVDALVEQKPHLKRRSAPAGVGQGLTDHQDDSVSLSSWLRGNAG